MFEAIMNSPFFGLGLTTLAWSVGVWAQKKTKRLLCNPLLIAVCIVLLVLVVFQIPYESYRIGGDLIRMMLGPVTAVLALNVYRQREILKEYFVPVLAGCLMGTITSICSVLLLCWVLKADFAMTQSLVPKSVTTAIAIGISESRGGVAGLTTTATLVTGLVGALFAPLFAKLFKITDPVAEGIAIGASSHALGTSRALEIGELQGAMSSIAICICGIFTSILVLFV